MVDLLITGLAKIAVKTGGGRERYKILRLRKPLKYGIQ
jgi:hypothetical protein